MNLIFGKEFDIYSIDEHRMVKARPLRRWIVNIMGVVFFFANTPSIKDQSASHLWVCCSYFGQAPRVWGRALRGQVMKMIEEMCEPESVFPT